MRVSIVTPSYNQGEYLERTLLSVLGQNYHDLEYIVVDGNSSDESQPILQKHSQTLHTLIVEPDGGQAEAINKGFAVATGEILGFLNSDDVLLPGTVEFLADYFAAHPDVDAVYSNRIFIDEHDQLSGFWVLPPHWDYCMCRWDFIPQETCFWRRSLLEQVGPLNEDLDFAIDYDLFVRMMRHGRFQRISRFLAAFRRHPDSKSSTVYETLGRKEVSLVRQTNEVVIHWYDHLLKYAFGGGILGSSYLFKLIALHRWRAHVRFPWQS